MMSHRRAGEIGADAARESDHSVPRPPWPAHGEALREANRARWRRAHPLVAAAERAQGEADGRAGRRAAARSGGEELVTCSQRRAEADRALAERREQVRREVAEAARFMRERGVR